MVKPCMIFSVATKQIKTSTYGEVLPIGTKVFIDAKFAYQSGCLSVCSWSGWSKVAPSRWHLGTSSVFRLQFNLQDTLCTRPNNGRDASSSPQPSLDLSLAASTNPYFLDQLCCMPNESDQQFHVSGHIIRYWLSQRSQTNARAAVSLPRWISWSPWTLILFFSLSLNAHYQTKLRFCQAFAYTTEWSHCFRGIAIYTELNCLFVYGIWGICKVMIDDPSNAESLTNWSDKALPTLGAMLANEAVVVCD